MVGILGMAAVIPRTLLPAPLQATQVHRTLLPAPLQAVGCPTLHPQPVHRTLLPAPLQAAPPKNFRTG